MSLLDCSNDVLVSDDDFLEYTKQWTTIRSRGGLYEVKDETFLFFQEVELVVQAKLEAKLAYVSRSGTAENFKNEIYQAVLADEVVLFHWSLLAVHLDDETCLIVLSTLSARHCNMSGLYIKQNNDHNTHTKY